jgi:predicted ATPase
MAARVLWLLGYPDQALAKTHEAVTLARELSHPYSLAFALGFAAVLNQLLQEAQAAQRWAEEVITLATEQGFALWLAWGTIMQGWALVEQGQEAEGIGLMRHGIAAYRGTGVEVAQPYWLALLAEAYREGGQAEEGLSVVAEALETVRKHEERYYEAELYRLKGELILTRFREHHAEAETCFRQANDIACVQQAISLELRAVLSLSRLWRDRGRREGARQLLAEIYSWFTEGFDTAGLQEARALLEAIARA